MSMLLLEIGLTNAALALALALVVALVSRWKSNAHLASILWLVVLFKFITPPLLPMSVAVKPRPSDSAAPTFATTNVVSPEPAKPSSIAARQTIERPKSGNTTSSALTAAAMQPAADPSELTTSHASGTATEKPGPTMMSTVFSALWNVQTLWGIWLAGAILFTVALLINAVRFNLAIYAGTAEHSPQFLHTTMQSLSTRMGVRRMPRLCMVDADISPLIWTWAGHTSILLPRRMMQDLSHEQQEMVLCHELAHIKRFDHYFRWLEAAVQCAYWWFLPLVWMRRQLHAAQEECCDAWVDRFYPEHRVEYCETLFNTAVRLTSARRSPMLASEFGRSSGLRQRMQIMLQQRLSQPLSKPVWALCLLCGALAAAFSVSWVTADEKEPEKPTVVIVVTDDDGKPITTGEAEIDVRSENGRSTSEKAGIEDGKASFFLKFPEYTAMTIELKSPGHQGYLKKYSRQPMGALLKIEPQYTFRLKKGTRIGGTIVDEAGKPLPDVKVWIHCPSNQKIEDGIDVVETTIITDADGHWEYSGVPDDLSRLSLQIRHASHSSSKDIEKVLPEHYARLKALADVRALTTAPSLTGTVVNPDGRPIQGAIILLDGVEHYQAQRDGLIPVTDESGNFEVHKPAPGVQKLTVFAKDWALARAKAAIPQTEPLKITMQKGARVEFRAVDTQGKPIAGIRFKPESPKSLRVPDDDELAIPRGLDFLIHRDFLDIESNNEGIWVWENAPAVPMGYQIYGDGYLSQHRRDYGPEGSPHKIVFRRRIPVHVTVVSAETGELVRDFKLMRGNSFKSNPPGLWFWNTEKVDKDKPGVFDDELRNLGEVARYRIQAAGFRPMVSREFDAENLPDAPIDLVFRLEAGATYSGVVLQPDGTPAEGATLGTKLKSNPDAYESLPVQNGIIDEAKANFTAKSDSLGRFNVLPHADPFVCFLSHESGYQQLMDVDLYAEKTVKLQPWAKVEGQLFVKGAPAANIAVTLRVRDSLAYESQLPWVSLTQDVKTDASGKFAFPKCPAGTYEQIITYDEKVASSSSHNPAYQQRETIRVEAGQVLVESIGKDGFDAVGRIALPDDPNIELTASQVYVSEPIENPPKDSRSNIRSSHALAIQPDGTFRCFNLLPAKHELVISIPVKAEDYPRPGYTRKLVITPDMFVGKSPSIPIDLGEIKVEPEQ